MTRLMKKNLLFKIKLIFSMIFIGINFTNIVYGQLVKDKIILKPEDITFNTYTHYNDIDWEITFYFSDYHLFKFKFDSRIGSQERTDLIIYVNQMMIDFKNLNDNQSLQFTRKKSTKDSGFNQFNYSKNIDSTKADWQNKFIEELNELFQIIDNNKSIDNNLIIGPPVDFVDNFSCDSK